MDFKDFQEFLRTMRKASEDVDLFMMFKNGGVSPDKSDPTEGEYNYFAQNMCLFRECNFDYKKVEDKVFKECDECMRHKMDYLKRQHDFVMKHGGNK